MIDPDLFNRALQLCIKFNSHAVAHDLHVMGNNELQGVIYFFSAMIVN